MIYSVKHFFLLMCIVFTNIKIISGRFSVIYRHLWNAQDETKSLLRFHLPIKLYQITVCRTKACNTIENCCPIVNSLQEEHVKQRGLPDIAYNFLVDGLGQVYEGTGWYSRAIVHEKEFLSICLFGINDYEVQSKNFFDGIMSILDFGKEIGYLSQTVKPILSLNKPSKIPKIQPQSKELMLQFFESTHTSKTDASSKESVSVDNTRLMTNINWSKVFPNRGNRTAWERIASHKRTIVKKSNWVRVFQNESQVTSADWSGILKNDSMIQVDWNEIFQSRDINLTNLNSFFSSSPTRIHRRLGHNNNLS